MSDQPTAVQRQKELETSFIDVGRGEAVVLIHGVGLNADAWAPQITELSKSHRVIAFDMMGHGGSDLPTGAVSLGSYINQLARLLDTLGIATANIVGHSMGGLVAIGFALAHPQRTLRLAVLNSVFQRKPEKRAAVVARARQISTSGTVGNIEEPLERWFGPLDHQLAIAQQVRQWLQSVNPRGYAMAYEVFAEGDTAFVGKLGQLTMPSLFATGSHDHNSTSEMAADMARLAVNGQALVLDNARHLMNLTHADEVNAALKDLLQRPQMTIDPKDLRKAFGTFMTGVTVVTTREENGTPRGFTANSFASVSLDPPLLLICISKAAASCGTFVSAQGFAVNILSESQKAISGVFASKRPDKFTDTAYTDSRTGNPILAGSVAWFDCARHSIVDAGDHIILIGRVTSYAHNDASPLGYARGGYVTLGLEQSAVNAAAQPGGTEVGAILECDGKLLVVPAAGRKLELPHVGRDGGKASASRLLAQLSAQGIQAELSFLYAVYENRDEHSQSIYYRGEASAPVDGSALLLSFDDLPVEKFRDDATRAMLKRYAIERRQGRYKIYSGDHVSGNVREVSDA